MKAPSLGLVDVATEHLEHLLRLVPKNEIACPLDAVEIARNGLQTQQESLLGKLRGLDRDAVRAVLVAVLAERRSRR